MTDRCAYEVMTGSVWGQFCDLNQVYSRKLQYIKSTEYTDLCASFLIYLGNVMTLFDSWLLIECHDQCQCFILDILCSPVVTAAP